MFTSSETIETVSLTGYKKSNKTFAYSTTPTLTYTQKEKTNITTNPFTVGFVKRKQRKTQGQKQSLLTL